MKSDMIILLTIFLFIFLILLIEVLFSDMNLYTVSLLLLCCVVIIVEYFLFRKVKTNNIDDEYEPLLKDKSI